MPRTREVQDDRAEEPTVRDTVERRVEERAVLRGLPRYPGKLAIEPVGEDEDEDEETALPQPPSRDREQRRGHDERGARPRHGVRRHVETPQQLGRRCHHRGPDVAELVEHG